jgi:O-antigen/teichoic acid export membrane protein
LPEQANINTPTQSILGQSVHNFVFSAFGTVSSMVLGFLFAGFSIKYLGEARAGYLIFLQSLIGLQLAFGGLGLGVPAVQRIARLHKDGDFTQARTLAGSVAIINLVSGTLTAALLICSFETVYRWSRLEVSYHRDAFYATVLVGINLILSQWTAAWQAVYQALQRFDLLAGMATTFGILNGLCGIAVLSWAPTLTAAAAISAALAAVQLLAGAIATRGLLNRTPWWAWNWQAVRPMLRFGGWTYLGGVGNILFTNIDRLVLTSLLGSSLLPYYALPQRMYSQVHSTITSYFQFLFPMLAAVGGGASTTAENLDNRLRWFVAILSGAAYTGLALIGPALLTHLVGREFSERAHPALFLACIQGFFHAQMIVPYYRSWAAGEGKPNAIMSVLLGTLVIPTSMFLIPRLGYVGASVAQLWIIVIAIGHSLWICRTLSREYPSWRWLSWMISPCAMIFTWILLATSLHRLLPDTALTRILTISISGLLGVAALLFIERVFFPMAKRWGTLIRAVEFLAEIIKRKRLLLPTGKSN